MKAATHHIHPDAVAVLSEFLPKLDAVLTRVYQAGDFSYTIQVEGQIIASKNTKNDVAPVGWAPDTVEAETEKRAVKKAGSKSAPPAPAASE